MKIKEGSPQHGTLAQYVLDKRIPLEIVSPAMCIRERSNTLSKSLRHLPQVRSGDTQHRQSVDGGITLPMNIDRRKVFGLTLRDLEKITINAMKSAFIPYKHRTALIYDVIKAGYAGET